MSLKRPGIVLAIITVQFGQNIVGGYGVFFNESLYKPFVFFSVSMASFVDVRWEITGIDALWMMHWK